MKVSELINKMNFEVCNLSSDPEVEGFYCGDLLSWVMGRAEEGSCWFTIMSNSNICAVAKLLNMSCIVLCEGVKPDEKLSSLVKEQEINLLLSKESMFDTIKAVTKLLAL